jgi:uncharacterized protein (DUF1697 family)
MGERMTVYVALVRGINVGGNNVVPMRALAATFARCRLDAVKTFIQSGNVLFRSDLSDARALERRLEKAIAKGHGCDVKVVVRTLGELRSLVRTLPRSWKKPVTTKRYYVMFLRHTVDSKNVLARVAVREEVEELVYRPGALLWSASIASLSRSRVAKIMATPLYRDVTVRNLATTLKLCALAEAMAEERAVTA